MNGNPADLPTMTDARIQQAINLLDLNRDTLRAVRPPRLRQDLERLGALVLWSQAAYDVLTGFLCSDFNGDVGVILDSWLPYLRALVRRENAPRPGGGPDSGQANEG